MSVGVLQFMPRSWHMAVSLNDVAPQFSDGLSAEPSAYGKENPFPATLSVRQKITGRNSDKDVRHIELDLAGSGLQYTAGDALGVWFDTTANWSRACWPPFRSQATRPLM